MVGLNPFFFTEFRPGLSFQSCEDPGKLFAWHSSVAVSLFADNAVPSFSISSVDDSELFARIIYVVRTNKIFPLSTTCTLFKKKYLWKK